MNDNVTIFDKSTLKRVYPYIVPRSWIIYAGSENVVTWAFSDDVHMILAVDDNGSVRNVRPEDLTSTHITIEEAFDISTQNLAEAKKNDLFSFGIATLQDNILIGGSQGNWMAPAGALILGSFYQILVENFQQEEFAAVAVNQSCLFAFPINEQTINSNSLKLAIEDEFTNHPKPISKSWLLLDGTWPSKHPLSPMLTRTPAK
jgi:hypothetical protein